MLSRVFYSLVLIFLFKLRHTLTRWECLEAVEILGARSLLSRPGYKFSFPGSSSVGRCTASSWLSDRSVSSDHRFWVRPDIASQTLSATSYQIVLLSGSNGETNVQLYIVGAIFFAASVFWYMLSRFKASRWVLSLPWFFFSIAFLLIGLPYISKKLVPAHDILSDVATYAYAIASAAGFAFFGLNFGEEAGAATEVWILRACIVQGSQQIWVAALWFWGDKLNSVSPGALTPRWIVCIVWPLAALCFVFMMFLLFGLPGKSLIHGPARFLVAEFNSNAEYYRQAPPKVPNFYATLFRRKLVLWFLISLVLRDFWLSGVSEVLCCAVRL